MTDGTQDTALPNDIEALKAVIALRDEALSERDATIERLTRHAEHLQEQLNLAIARRYGARSEKGPSPQRGLFDEAEVEAEREALAAEEPPAVESVVAGHIRKARGYRKPLPAALPRVDIIHELPEDERRGPDGQPMRVIGEEISEQLDIVPATIRVLRHVRLKYGWGDEDGESGVKIAPLPPQPLPKTMASPGLLAHIVVSKYQDALPLYRQEQILTRIGVDLPRATLARWMVGVGTDLIQPVINLLRDRMLAHGTLSMDETPTQVLKEPGKSPQSQSYLWVQRGGPPEAPTLWAAWPIILFDYDPSRSQEVPLRLLEGFQGILQTDGYAGYYAAVRAQGLIHAGCLAHARRRFDEVIKSQGKHRKKGLAEEALVQIQKLYAVEKAARAMSPAERQRHREIHARPVWDTLRTWLTVHRPGVPPQSALGRALTYLANEWDKLVVYLTDGRVPIDNNATENALRPFCLGRRNWMFSDTVAGAQASANLYGLIETAKACGLEPYHYLRRIFTDLPKARTLEDIEALLPMNLTSDPTLRRSGR
ncbi:IS66 family transposase [Acidiferrobacter thiooxydans]|uniref:IS66 family transposase n=1 Tax=Acidiferrobacter thiooxydans TaxID=163359 RepID=UPI0008262E37|nr:IS66 family transposase [Acidiferrobacter thiooxydans]UEO00456.1 IS66 family transposase [Acidiferrobacter thiooxydans]